MLAIVFPQIDPVLFHLVGPISIRWYSIAYFLGIIIGTWLLYILNKEDNKQLFNSIILEDILFYATLGIVLGGRIGHVVIYDYNTFINDPVMIFKLWEGGMSFHGGLLGLIVSIYLLSKKHKIGFLYLTDLIACVAPIGLFFGRVANFINAELCGRPTNVSWGVIFPNLDRIPRHPSQVYEALLEGVLLLVIMMSLRFKTNYKKQQGFLSGIFMIFYAVFRFISEYYREPDYNVGFLTIGQLLSFPILIVGIFLIYKSKNR